MVDIVDAATRSRMMAGIRGKNTKPEVAVRKALHARGIRYRLHAKNLPGKPDLVFPKYRATVFVHGCFWHRHDGCRYATTPATRPEFWEQKFASNMLRDIENRMKLEAAGWRHCTVWECAVRRNEVPEIAKQIDTWLHSRDSALSIA